MRQIMIGLTVLCCTTQTLDAKIIEQPIDYRHGDAALRGFLYYDDAVTDKRPGVLVVHEWWGLNDYAKRRGRMLAELGYVAFAADMYGQGKVTADPSQARQWATHLRGNVKTWRQRTRAALDVLKRQPQTDTGRIAAIGYCFGGTTVLDLALSGTDIQGVVSFHGSPPAIDPGTDVTAKLLVCHGGADGFVKPEAITKFHTALNDLGVDWQMIAYGQAQHSFTNPGADAHGMNGVAYNEAADRRSWADMQQFFDELFADPPASD